MAGSATIGSLRVVLGLDSAAFTDGMNKAQKHLAGVSRSMQRAGQQIATVGAGLTASITAPIIAVGIKFARAAIAAEEMRSAFTVSFGAMAKDVEAWAVKSGDAMGRSTFELQEMALGFNGLFKAGGPITAQAAGMSRQFTLLAQDLSSFHNLAQEDVFAALRSGLSGEAEPLRRFNVYLTEGAVQAEAYAMGLATAGAKLTEQQKIQARASLIMRGTVEAQGDVLRTSDSTQNSIRALQAAWAELSVTMGQRILPAITPIIKALNTIAVSFSGLSPKMQTFIVAGAAIAAALGPVVVVIGAVVGAVGILIASPLLPFIAAASAGAAVLAVVFAKWGKDIIPVLQAFGKQIAEVLGPKIKPLMDAVGKAAVALGSVFSAIFSDKAGGGSSNATVALKAFGLIVSRIMGAVVDVFTGQVEIITQIFRALAALFRGDFSAMWNALGSAAKAAAMMVARAFQTMFPEVVQWVRQTYEGVKNWLGDKLMAVFTWVSERAKAVGDAFFQLYDRVVGHSYVPDLVIEVGQWMSRLQQVMVEPAQQAAEDAASAFQTLRDDARGVMEGLLTDQERATLEYIASRKKLTDAIAAGVPGSDVLQQGVARLDAGWDARDMRLPDIPELNDLGSQAIDWGDSLRNSQQAFDDAAQRFGDQFSDVMTQALNGDIKGAFANILSDTLRSALSSLGSSLFKSFSGGSGGGGIGSAIASLFGKLPKFADGGVIPPGGSGGVDSQLVAFWKSPSEQVDIRKPGQDMGGGLTRVIVETNDDRFNAYVDGRVAPAVASSEGRMKKAMPSIVNRGMATGRIGQPAWA